MIELLFQWIAVLAYLLCGFRIACFSHGGNFHRGYSWLAALLIGSFLGQSIHILFFKDPVTLWDAIFAVLLGVLIWRSKGKPLILLFICVALVLTFKFVLKSQQKIGALEQALSEKQQQLEQQASRIKSIQTSVSEQQKSIVELQKVQSDLQSKFEQRQITLKEIFAHDEPSKSWSVQPIPDAVRSMFNTAPTHNRSQIVSSAHPLQ